LLTHLPGSSVVRRIAVPLAPIWTDPNSLEALMPMEEKEEIGARDAVPQRYRGTERWRLVVFVAGAGLMAGLWSAVLGMAVWSLVDGEGDAWMVWTTGMTLFSWVSLGLVV
jgi:hypothetical protein